ncbi:hypothetical protein [Nitrosophilus alvini]|uniref:hypothetical protein n=1 Tax=Nitrosophilus alvini TaxID=2714855 RepID=UPI00190ACA17|nr:hypothetical protein [Nitrosophilus alvini]
MLCITSSKVLDIKLESLLINDMFRNNGNDKLNYDFIPFEKRQLQSVKLIKLYFLHRGRNAWYGTWTRHFIPDMSLYKSLEEAQKSAEDIRKQGNVFYIEELPAILFEFEDNVGMIVTQINTETPLSEFDFKKLNNFIETKINIKDDIRGENIEFIFNHKGEYWKAIPDNKDSLITIFIESTKNFELLKTTPLKGWKSKSIGKDYFLQWNKFDDYKISQTYIRKIYKIFGNFNL